MEITDTDRAYLAGLFEMAGSFHIEEHIREVGRGKRLYTYPRMRFHTTNEHAVKRAYAITGMGSLYEDYPVDGQFLWVIGKREDIENLAIELGEILSDKRRSQMMRVIKRREPEVIS